VTLSSEVPVAVCGLGLQAWRGRAPRRHPRPFPLLPPASSPHSAAVVSRGGVKHVNNAPTEEQCGVVHRLARVQGVLWPHVQDLSVKGLLKEPDVLGTLWRSDGSAEATMQDGRVCEIGCRKLARGQKIGCTTWPFAPLARENDLSHACPVKGRGARSCVRTGDGLKRRLAATHGLRL